MIGKGPRHERETTIVFNEEEPIATIWTASEQVYRRLKKNGYMPDSESDRSASFTIPKKQIRLPRPPSQARVNRGIAMAKQRSERKS